MNRICSIFLLSALSLSVVAISSAADLDRAVLEDSSSKFNVEVNDLHRIVLSAFDNAITICQKQRLIDQAALIHHDREKFVKKRILSIWLDKRSLKNYESRLDKACTRLFAVWDRAIVDLRKSGDETSALRLEEELGQLLIRGRGYGLALPSVGELGSHHFRIRNVATNLVMDVDDGGALILRSEIRLRQRQLFQFILFDESCAIKNCDRGKVLNIPSNTATPDTRIIFWSRDGSDDNEKWKLVEKGRYLEIAAVSNGLMLAVGTDVGNTQAFVKQVSPKTVTTNRWTIEFAD